MQIPDVNVLIDAWRPASQHHVRAREWLQSASIGAEGLGLIDVVATGAVRVLTLPVAGLGADLDEVLESVDSLRHAPAVRHVHPGPRQWQIFTDICRQTNATGNAVPDCYIASLALEHGATLVSRDRFFQQITGLQWSDLP